MSLHDLFLRKGADRRLRAGHLWVYSNEVDTGQTPLAGAEPGTQVRVRASNGDVLGSAYLDPRELICARVYAPGKEQPLDLALCTARIQSALALREQVFTDKCYRLIYGDSDLLPGVVVDRYGPYLVLQLNNAGIECFEAPIVEALCSVVAPEGILLRADSRNRREQGLQDRLEVVFGEVPDEVPLIENGVRFLAPVHGGQKTGWFYDHRMSRARLAGYVEGKSVLDVFSYIGGWGIQAAAFGAQSVCCVDSSAAALDGVVRNAQLNSLADRVTTLQGNAADVMQELVQSQRRFDVVILDPPAYIQRRKDLKKGVAAYRKINELGLRLLEPGGLLVSGSCSMHLSRADLNVALQGAAQRAHTQLRIIEQGAQGPDHPIHPAIPETEYLKAVFSRRVSL